MNNRPIGVTVLAVLAGLAAIVAGYHTLQFLHILPFSLGPVRFFTFDLLGALIWGVLVLIWLWVARGLWGLDRQAWVFVSALALINLVFDFIAILGGTAWQAMLPALVVNGLVLIYSQLPGTKAAFNVSPGA